GYQKTWPSRLLLGIEIDATFPDFIETEDYLSSRATSLGAANEQLQFLATLRGRLGWAFDGWTPFVTGGLAWGSTRISRTDSGTGVEAAPPGVAHLGFTVGAGVDVALDRRWSARAEYLFTSLGLTGHQFQSAPARYDSQYDLHEFRLGLNYHFG